MHLSHVAPSAIPVEKLQLYGGKMEGERRRKICPSIKTPKCVLSEDLAQLPLFRAEYSEKLGNRYA